MVFPTAPQKSMESGSHKSFMARREWSVLASPGCYQSINERNTYNISLIIFSGNSGVEFPKP